MKLGWLRPKERFAKPTALSIAFEKAAQDFAKEAGVKHDLTADWQEMAAPFEGHNIYYK